MLKLVLAAVCLLSASDAVAAPKSTAGQRVLDAAFDPDRSFRGDLNGGDDEVVLTAWASARDTVAPSYSLAIAYRCAATAKSEEYRCGYNARILRVGDRPEAKAFEDSMALAAQASAVTDAAEMRRALARAKLEWLEADVDACPNGIHAMDSVRVSDWRPDIHYGLQAREDREIIMHPAAIRITMSGSYATSTYEGWRLAAGVPAAVIHLLETLEPCWKPATSRRPWDRP